MDPEDFIGKVRRIFAYIFVERNVDNIKHFLLYSSYPEIEKGVWLLYTIKVEKNDT